MPQTRPIECPACGYERIQRTHFRTTSDHGREPTADLWKCRLCDYEWKIAISARAPDDDWVMA
jgi:rubredoxin